MRKGLIYICKNKINGKVYIGQTVRVLEKRIERHLKDAKYGSQLPFHRAIRKYGKENFEWSIIEKDIEFELLDAKEKDYIKVYNSVSEDFGYNVAIGGHGGLGNRIIDEKKSLEIINLLQETQLSFAEIANLYGVSLCAVSDISRGKAWKQDNLVYPIRRTKPRKRIAEDTINSIIKDIIEDKISTFDIAERYNVGIRLVDDINSGRLHKSEDHKYPLRKINFRRHQSKLKLNEQDVENIIRYLRYTNITIKGIAQMYKVSETTIADIDKGRSWKDCYNGTYPIRNKKVYGIVYPLINISKERV